MNVCWLISPVFILCIFPGVGCLLFLDSLFVAVCSCCLFVRLVFESISAQTHLRKTHADRMHITNSVHWSSRQTGHGVTNSAMWWYDVKCVCHVWLWMFLMQYIEQKCHPLNSDTQIKRPRRRVVLFTTEWIVSSIERPPGNFYCAGSLYLSG